MSITKTLKVISDPVRRNILELLKDGQMSIAEKFDLTNAAVSYHLSQLKQAGLILENKQKNFIYYELNLSVFEDIRGWIQSLGGNENEKA